MWLYCGHFQQHKQLGLLSWIGDCLIPRAIVICESQNIISSFIIGVEMQKPQDVKLKMLSLSLSLQILGRPNCVTLNLERLTQFEHVVQFHITKLQALPFTTPKVQPHIPVQFLVRVSNHSNWLDCAYSA